MTVDDFHRLGLRQNEARPRIIRLAASSLAERLQNQASGNDSAPSLNDLANLCTTTYRLLDPRRRRTATERALLSQSEQIPTIPGQWIHPRSLQQTDIRNRAGFGALAHESLLLGQQVFPDPDAPPPTQLQLSLERWSDYARQRVIWAALFLALLIGMLLARQFRFSKSNELASDPAESSPVAAAPADRSPQASENPANTTAPQTQPVPESKPDSTPQPAPDLKPAPSPDPAPVSTPEPIAPPVTSPDPVTEAPLEAIVTPASEPMDEEEIQQLTDQLMTYSEKIAGFMTLFEDPAEGEETAAAPSPTPVVPAVQPPPEDVAVALPLEANEAPAKTALPSPTARNESRDRLERLLADRPVPVSDAGREQAVYTLLDLRQNTATDSADWLAITEMAAERMIELGNHPRSAALIREATQHYEVSQEALTITIAERLEAAAVHQTDHRRLLSWGIETSEKWLQAEAYAPTIELMKTLAPSGNKANQPALRKRFDNQRDSIIIMKRMAESAKSVLATHTLDDATATDSTLIGRYRCLMLRDWEAGIVWLAQASDSRLSGIATNEIAWQTSQAQDPQAGFKVAEEWIEYGSRVRGRMGDSAKLHGYTILQSIAGKTAGLEALEIQKRIGEIESELVGILPSTPAATTPMADAPNIPAGEEATSSMLGRLLVDGRDRGVAIQYEPGTTIDDKITGQIFQALNQQPTPFQLQFQAVLRLAAPTTIRIIAAGPAPPAGEQIIRVNGERQNLLPGLRGSSVAMDLPAGQHHLHWQIAGKEIGTTFFFVQDDQTSQRLPLLVLPDPNPLPTPIRINLIRSR